MRRRIVNLALDGLALAASASYQGCNGQRQLVFRSLNYIATQRLARMLRDNIDGKRPNIMQ
jgi:hypothetical protein